MSLSVSQKMNKSVTLLQRMAIAFGITDEIFAISVQRNKKLSASYMAGLILTPLIGWVGGTTVGAVATSIMPTIVSQAMGISLYAMFIAIVMPPARNDNRVLLAVILSVILSLIFNYIPVFKGLGNGWIIIIITLIVSTLFATLFPLEIKEEEYE